MVQQTKGGPHTCLIIILVIIILGFVGYLYGKFTDTPKPIQQKTDLSKAPAVITISPAKLFAEYKAGRVVADKKYKGQVVDMTGIIYEIGKTTDGKNYINFLGGTSSNLDLTQCQFDPANDNADKLAKLKQGNTVNVRGVVAGKFSFVVVEYCNIN